MILDFNVHINLQQLTSKRAPGDNTRMKDSVEYYTWLAQLAEKGKTTCIFFADVYGGTILLFAAASSAHLAFLR
jgi:hypothetical protein